MLYRINTVEIHLPPLRERKGDISLLVEHFLNIYRKKYNKPELIIDANTLSKLENYSWYGNVRELQHVIERSVILCENNLLEPNDILLNPTDVNRDNDKIDTFNLDEIEKQVIQKALLKFEGNISKAAKELGLTRTSLYRRMEKHGL